MAKSSFKSTYGEMYMIPSDIYKKMLDCITEDEKQNLYRINKYNDQTETKNQGVTSIDTQGATRTKDTIQSDIIQPAPILPQVNNTEPQVQSTEPQVPSTVSTTPLQAEQEEVKGIEKQLEKNENLNLSDQTINESSKEPVARLRPEEQQLPGKDVTKNFITNLQKELLKCRDSLSKVERELKEAKTAKKITPNKDFLDEMESDIEDEIDLPPRTDILPQSTPSISKNEKYEAFQSQDNDLRRSSRLSNKPYLNYAELNKPREGKIKTVDKPSKPKANNKNKNRQKRTVITDDGTSYIENDQKRFKLKNQNME